MEKRKEQILEEYKKGNIVVAGIEGLQVMSVVEFIKQPIDGILYDLNRLEEVVLTFIEDPKWVNDLAVCKTIRKLKSLNEDLESENKRLLGEIESLKEKAWKYDQLCK